MIYSNYSLFKRILGNSEVTVEKGSRSRPVYVSDEGGGHKGNTPTNLFQKTSGSIRVVLSLGGWGLDSRDCVSIVRELTVNVENRLSGRWIFTGGFKGPITTHFQSRITLKEAGWRDSGTWALNCTGRRCQTTFLQHGDITGVHTLRGSADVKQKRGFV